ncbi:Membrane protease subunit, stomatin/prohibitin family, contains C-terminal Zn-ribbon domain [Chitinophaga costaii]|uniref:Membrane protease subunit, stomatin/prohibitin family, contains C-terminal Zn-ribbon domain n=1 Tax=Chitinophaga costaii TaxID=1335309 RepID=A0A1C4CPW1_9BACT|nr:SPFH domain-containing protein [Chitinophaga costaii]PUZ27004.1 SPFH domain-containing protein [Chitinophaga costaii]SCC21122.1 Membrane protease subunit, stomatin/prohibitin family, contains C-terminal Zn-ribbon domain [Chitinophaga costaii]
MGIFDKLRNEFIDIIEWVDNTSDTLVWKFPRYQNEIKMNAKLTVRESQLAVFINEGKIADIFQPGMYTLTTQNLPILSTLKGWGYGFNSPFKADVFFVSTRQFTNQKWGTKNPVMLRDAEFGPVRLRAFGSYAFRVKDAGQFLKEIAATNPEFTVEDINEQLRNLAVSRGMDAIAEAKIPVLDLAAKYDEVSALITEKIKPEFNELGLDLTKFLIENISLPEEVEAALDKRSSMGIIGNLGAYAQFQAANAMGDAAKNPSGGGLAGAGIGVGLGAAMGSQMGNVFQQNQFPGNATAGNAGAGAPPPPPPAAQIFLAINGQQEGPYDLATLQQLAVGGRLNAQTLVWKAGMGAWAAASTLPEVAVLLGSVPPPLP